MKISCTSKARLLYIPATAFFLCVCSISTVGFVPDPGRYQTPREAVEYVAWKALKEGRPPCVTIHPIGISLFCVMGQCAHSSNGKPYCKCNETFTGLTCSVYVGKCTNPDMCVPHLCQDDPTKDSGFKCVCNDGFYVPNDPEESFCVKDEKTEGSVGADAVNVLIPVQVVSTGTAQKRDLPIEEQRAAQTESAGSDQLTTLIWKKDNSSGMAVLCANSDFLICFIEPNEEDKAIDALLKKTLVEVVKRKRASLEPKRPLAGRHKEVGAKHATEDGEGINMGHLLNSRISKHATLSRSSRRDPLRDRKIGAPIMQRRAVSTFQTLEKGIFVKIVSGIESSLNMNAADANRNSEDEVRASEDSFSNSIRNEGNHTAWPRISHGYSNSPNKLPEGPKAPFIHADPSHAPSLMPPKDNSEGTKSIRSLENQPHRAAYSAGSETRKAVQKSHSEDKQLVQETADEIIDDLKNAVQTSEHDRPNITNISHTSDVSIKLSNVVQAHDEDDLKNSDDNLNLREVVSDDMHGEESQTSEGGASYDVRYPGTVMTLSNKHQKLGNLGEPHTEKSWTFETPEPSLNDSDEQHTQSVTATSKGATTRERKIPSSFVTYDYDESGIPRPSHLKEQIPSAAVHIITNATGAQRSRADDDNRPLSSDVATRHSKKERSSYVSLRRDNRTFALRVTQREGERTMKVIHAAPLLLLNVTLLSKERNSTTWHVVPATGTNAVLISWNIYNPEVG